jgi:S-adenosylmethionine hydrolase
MELKHEKSVKAIAEVNKQLFIGPDNGVLYQYIDDKEIIIHITSTDETREVKIHITKE